MIRPPPSSFATRHRKKLIALAFLVVGPAVAHGVIVATTRIEPPSLAVPPSTAGESFDDGASGSQPRPKPRAPAEPSVSPSDTDLRILGPAYARHRGKILEVRLAGTPEQIGRQHVRLLYPEMIENEGTLYRQLEHYVPFAPARALLMDISRVQFRHVDRGMPDHRRREIASGAAAFAPDPYAGFLPTYQRFVFLNALYDIALSFEHSPLLGCTSFALTDGAAADGHVVLARNFDFEAGPVFDEKKAVFLVREEGRVPYASVSWPGLVGAVTGMNAAGLALVVHGGRARQPSPAGEPIMHTMRELLGRARTTREALAILERTPPMVSHLVMLADAGGDVAVAERAPGEPIFVRRGRGKVPLTNHFEGPLADDPANRKVETVTSTRPRRLRLDELLENLPAGADVQAIVKVLRDHQGVGGVDLPLGSRRTIDALIATHSVVMDATARVMWVSEGPHLAGRYLRFDVGKLLDPSYEPVRDPLEAIPEDPILTTGAYGAWVRAGSPHRGEP